MKTIGIIGAMPSELKDLREALGEAEIIKAGSYEFYVNMVGDKKIVNVCCGVAKVNSAVATQLLIDKFEVDCVINTGIAGGVGGDVKVCDIVISTDVMHHDVTPRFLANYPPYNNCFKASEELIEMAKKACEANDKKYHTGRVVSGEQFISDSVLKQAIIDDFAPLAVDMESAAVGHTAYRNEIPFVIIRCVSDNADDEGEMTYDEFEIIAAKTVADVVLTIING